MGISVTLFIGQMSFLSPNQQCQSTEGNTKSWLQPVAWPHPFLSLDFWWKGRCSFYARSPTPVPGNCRHVPYTCTNISTNTKLKNRANTSTRWHFAFMLCCHSNEIHAPVALIHPIVHNQGTSPTIPPSYIRVHTVVWACGHGQTDTQTDAHDQYTFCIVYNSCEM